MKALLLAVALLVSVAPTASAYVKPPDVGPGATPILTCAARVWWRVVIFQCYTFRPHR